MQPRRKIGVIGSGMVGQTLAAGFHSHGDAVMVGTRSPARRLLLYRTESIAVGPVLLGSFLP